MFGSRIESRLKEFPFLWALKPLDEPWSSHDTVKVKVATRDLLGRNTNPDRKWWAYVERTDSEANTIALKLIEVPWNTGSFAEAIQMVVKHWGTVKFFVSSERSQIHTRNPLYIVWRVPAKM